MSQLLQDVCIIWLYEVIFGAFIAKLDKGTTLGNIFMGDILTFCIHVLQSLDGKMWNNASKEHKLNFLIVEFRSLLDKLGTK